MRAKPPGLFTAATLAQCASRRALVVDVSTFRQTARSATCPSSAGACPTAAQIQRACGRLAHRRFAIAIIRGA
jgi:hypothetical protein